jgi:hypothetical protein
MSIRIFAIFGVLASLLFGLAGCASEPEFDGRAGTKYSPYRSMPAYIECDDCKTGSQAINKR